MMKKFKKQMKNEKGLTLIELLAVIVILAIVAVIAVPAIGSIIQNSRENAFVADAQNALAAANLYFVEETPEDNSSINLDDLKGKNFLTDIGSMATATITYKKGGENTISATGKAGKIDVEIETKTNKELSEEGRDALK